MQQRQVPRVPAPVLTVLEGLSALFAVPVARLPWQDLPWH